LIASDSSQGCGGGIGLIPGSKEWLLGTTTAALTMLTTTTAHANSRQMRFIMFFVTFSPKHHVPSTREHDT
jgi:hypothetical protein